MEIGVSTELLGVGGVFVLIWLVLALYYVPSRRRLIRRAEPDDLVRLNRNLALLAVLRDIALAGVVAFGVLIMALVGLNVYVGQVAETEGGLVGLMDLRQSADIVLERLQAGSVAIWAGAIALIGLIWAIVSRRRSAYRWQTALDARRTALRSQAMEMEFDSLRSKVGETDSKLLVNLEDRVNGILGQASQQLADLRAARFFSVGGTEETSVSLDGLGNLQDHILSGAFEADMAGEAEKASEMRETALSIETQILEIKKDFPIKFTGLSGPVETTLERAETDLEAVVAPPGAQHAKLVDTWVEHLLQTHIAEGRSRAGSEPETLREWIVAGGTSEAVTKGAGLLGRMARTTALIVFLLGFVGLGTNAFGVGVAASLMDAELSLARNLSAQSVETAAARTEAEEDPAETLASDVATEAVLRATMRASFARAAQTGMAPRSAAAVFAPRQQFDLAAVNARQRILAASTRPAAAATQGGAKSATSYTVRAAHAQAPTARVDIILDPPIDQRIAQLRSNERIWTNLRAAAARPATPDLAAQQFLRVAFADEALLNSHQMRMMADRVTTDVARRAALTGGIPHGYTPDMRTDLVMDAFSSRDRRIIADFESRSVGRAGRYIDGVATGRIDPGSLHRTAPTSPLRPGGGSAYADLFPAVVDGDSSFDRGNSSSKPRVAAKSYKAVRFNRRVGGVVIGRGPENGEPLDIIGFDWAIRADRLHLSLISADATRFSLGGFDPAIAHHALAYAADGRVVATTLPLFAAETAALDVPTRRVVVHPAFEDTRFACDAIQIDRFVDSAMYNENHPPAMTEKLISARGAVTGFGQVLRYAGPPDKTPQIVSQFDGEMQRAFDHAKSCGTGQSCFPMQTYSGYGMDFGAVDKLMSCFARASSYQQCVSHLTDLYSETTYSVDSGVREAAYVLDPDLKFLTGAGVNDPLWPLDFIVQAVPQPIGNADIEISEDWEPWAFPSFKSDLRALVLQEIRGNPGAASVHRNVREFVVLQRLFRTALDGHLGLDFPLAELVPMQETTAEYIVIQQQEHWNHSDRFYQFMVEQYIGLLQDIADEQTTTTVGGVCHMALQRALEVDDAEENWPAAPGLWPEIAAIETACNLLPSLGLGKRIADLNAMGLIEEAIFIHASQRRPRAPLSCFD